MKTYNIKLSVFLLAFIFSISSISAQPFFNSNPTCSTDSVQLSYNPQGLPSGQITWTISQIGFQRTVSIFDNIKVLLGANGTYPLQYEVTAGTPAAVVDAGTVQLVVDSNTCNWIGYNDPNALSGIVYYDANQNGIKDSSELPIPNLEVTMTPDGYGQTTATTNINGQYTFYCPPGTYQIRLAPQSQWTQTAPTNPNMNVVSFTSYLDQSNDNHFGLIPVGPLNDLDILLIPVTRTRPGFDTRYYMRVSNLGTFAASGSVTVTHDNRLTYTSSTPAEDSYTANELTYNFSNLAAGTMLSYFIDFTAAAPPTLNINDTVLVTAFVDTVGDDDHSNNFDTLPEFVIGAYDPNDKTAYPQGIGETGIQDPTQTLRYLVRFQNTGNAEAINVSIADTLDAHLDLSTLNVLDASHTNNLTIDQATNSLQFNFPNIMLPDSGTSELDSHGFISFEVDVIDWDQLPNGTEINNTAHIYFDFNPAIVTNTTRTTFDTTDYTGINELNSRSLERSVVYPNPSNGKVVVEFESKARSYSIQVLDINGKEIIMTRTIDGDRTELDLHHADKGLYFYQILSEGTILSRGRFIVQ